MKTIITTIALIVSTLITTAQTKVEKTTLTKNGNTITVTVPVKSGKGHVYAALHNEKTFMRAKALADANSSITDGIATITFTNVTAGEYGITLFLDSNGNKKMDFEANGMPKEMYGISNNVMNFGPPQWSDAKFTITDQSVTMEIIM